MGKPGKVSKEEKQLRKQKKASPLPMVMGGLLLLLFLGLLSTVWPYIRHVQEWRSLGREPPPDTRPKRCPVTVPVEGLRDSVTVIVPFLNEEWFRIEATMKTFMHYTDMSLVKEIMWIADGCDDEKIFKDEIEAFYPNVSVQVNERNLGLIVTKMQASQRAQGSVLVFLEPHLILNRGWLEPLLHRLGEEPKALVMPGIDAVTKDLAYQQANVGHWRFEWNLNLVYTNPTGATHESMYKPFASPATSGGIYAIRKDWWDQLDLFDPELVRWGGDHVEASHKVWRCGGRIEVHPCSRLGHWFREPEHRPYDVKVQLVIQNYKRLAEVWYDNYTKDFYKIKPEAISMEIGDLTAMKQRRENLQCKDMKWYLENVDVELDWERTRACIPNASPAQNGCGLGTKAAGVLTTVVQAMPGDLFKRKIQEIGDNGVAAGGAMLGGRGRGEL